MSRRKLSPVEMVVEKKQMNTPITFVISKEEYRVLSECGAALTGQSGLCSTVYLWDARKTLVDRRRVSGPALTNMELMTAIEWFSSEVDENSKLALDEYSIEVSPLVRSALFVFDGVPESGMDDPGGHGHSSPMMTRVLKEARHALISAQRSIFFVSHVDEVPPELDRYVDVIRYGLPGRDFLESMVRKGSNARISSGSSGTEIPPIRLDQNGLDTVVNELRGLTTMEVDEALSTANRRNATDYVLGRTSTREFEMSAIRDVKYSAIRRSGTMQLLVPEGGLEIVAGMDRLKAELEEVKMMLGVEAREDGIRPPKGFLVVGPGGTGKSLVAKCVGRFLDRQVARLDVGACKGSLLGQSEGNLRAALAMVNELSPIVLFMDEFEKMWGGSSSSGVSDGGTTSNMLQTWLTWMQDEKDPNVFVVAASNDIQNIPGPVVRSGRFDDIVYVGLPGKEARKEAIDIHFRKRGWDVAEIGLDMEAAAAATISFSGAEIERTVEKTLRIKARTRGFGRDIHPTDADFAEAAAGVSPLSRTHPREIRSLEEWVKSVSVVSASSEEPDFVVTERGVEALRRSAPAIQSGTQDDFSRGDMSVEIPQDGGLF